MSGGGTAAEVQGRNAGRNRGRWLALLACSLGFFVANLHRISPGVFASELMEEFGASASVFGLLSSSYFYTYGLLQVPVGMLCDRYRPGLVMGFFMLAGAAGSALFAASTSLATAMVGRVLLSAGVSAVFISALRVFDYSFGRGGFSMATGVMAAAGNFGGIAAQGPLALAVLRFGWRSSMYLIALATLAVALFIVFATGGYGRRASEGKGGGAEGRGFSPKEGRREYLIMLTGLSIGLLVQYGIQMGYQGLWGIPFLTDIYGLTKTAAGKILMLTSIGAMVGAPLTGWLLDGRGLSAHKLMLWSSSIFLASWIPLSIRMQPAGLAAIAFASLIMGGGGSMTVILNPTYANRYISEGSRGRFFGILNSASMVGAAIFQPLMGIIIDASTGSAQGIGAGYLWSFRLGLLAAAAVLSIRIAMFLRYRWLREPAVASPMRRG